MGMFDITTREGAMKLLFPAHGFLALLIFIFPFLDLDLKNSNKAALAFGTDPVSGFGIHYLYVEGNYDDEVVRYDCNDEVDPGILHECRAARITLYITFGALVLYAMAAIKFYLLKDTENRKYYPTFAFLYISAIVSACAILYYVEHDGGLKESGLTRGAQWYFNLFILIGGVVCLVLTVFAKQKDPKKLMEGSMGMNYEALLTDHN